MTAEAAEAPEPIVRRVLGGGPFAEIGDPAVAVADDRSGLLAVGGDVGSVQWTGGPWGTGWSGHRIGVYERDGLRCRYVLRSGKPVRALAFHPVLPLLAVGTGCYDGGYFFEGELLLVRVDTGDVVSALEYEREVLDLAWHGSADLRLVLSPSEDWEGPVAHEQGHTAVVHRADWGAVGPGSVLGEELDGPVAPYDRPDRGPEARRLLAELAGAAGRGWSLRRRVWAVEGLPDGRVLAALDGVLAESWLPSGERQWAVGDEEGGRQLVMSGDAASVWANAERLRSHARPGRQRDGARIARIAIDTGRVLETVRPDGYAILVAGGGRRMVLRPAEIPSAGRERLSMSELPGPAGALAADVQQGPGTGGFPLFNHPFPVRRASRPYVLVGSRAQWSPRDLWVSAVDADGTPRPLFPHGRPPAADHFGGPAVEIAQSLVYAGSVYEPHARRPGSCYVVRRSLDGAVLWEHRGDHRAIALDSDGKDVYAADVSGALTVLDAGTGAVRRRMALAVDGVPTCALSLAVSPQKRLLVGTVDGRVVEYEGDRPRPA
ncbi:peptide ABC transporter ATPase [Streptomyces sp. NRRL F-2664]|uniref:peptide ABC transporter ATPase n=1 Tax=Streptomyces sp. NRRL F-2664 TaxID=1463842 RepID=UPI0004C8ABD3|nr:peptide ABC transporter ATPase [Streptomyces sp. NRRL F-2664]